MSTLRGERFHIDLPEGDDVDVGVAPEQQPADVSLPPLPVSDFVGDVLERAVTDSDPPQPPSLKNEASGFPPHKSRTGSSKFRQSREQKLDEPENRGRAGFGTTSAGRGNESVSDDPTFNTTSFENGEKARIDQENREKLAQMSHQEIEKERLELMSTLDPRLIEKLLKRSTIEDGNPQSQNSSEIPEATKDRPKRPSSHSRKVSFAMPDAEEQQPKPQRPTAERHSISFSNAIPSTSSTVATSEHSRSPSRSSKRPSPSHRKVSFAVAEGDGPEAESRQTAERHSFSSDSSSLPTDPENPPVPRKYSLNPLDTPPLPPMHFPRPPPVDLDPNSATFLDDLHAKYFPDLAHDPSKLEWMQPPDPSEDAAYDPSADELDPRETRFSFSGKIIPPAVAHALPTNLGLHNHGDAPSAAGYTIAELARLARSAFPAQRCLAMQTLGRILYRLGIGEFGDETVADDKAVLAKGLWNAVDEGRCIETLLAEANKTQGHQTSIAVAQEAVWLWRRGGGRRMAAI